MNTKRTVIFTLALVLVIAGIIFSMKYRKPGTTFMPPTSQDIFEQTPGERKQPTSSQVGIEGVGAVTTHLIQPTRPQPSLVRPFQASDLVPQSVVDHTRADLERLALQIKKTPLSIDAWLQVGLDYEAVGDYKGAEEAYLYVKEISPTYYVTYHNLGNLYRAYLKDYVKAEVNMKKVIEFRPTEVPEYINLSDLYRYNYEAKKDLADDILLQGLGKNPQSTDLMIYLASYYADTGDKVRAKEFYTKALALLPNSVEIKQDLARLGN